MIINKLFLSKMLVEGYVKTPPSLQEQAITKLAIHLCQLFPLKQDIICASDALTVKKSREKLNCYNTWDNLIESRSKAMCEALPLATAFKSELIIRIRWIALELFSWNKQHQAILHTSAYVTDQFLTPSDWTIEGRLDEAKIAERLVQDEKIPPCRRYRLACIHSLEPFIHPLWDQATPEERNRFCASNNLGNRKKSELVKLKSYQLAGRLHELELNGGENLLWQHQLKEATGEGARTAFVNVWKALSDGQKQEVIIPVAMHALSQNMAHSKQAIWMSKLMENRYYRQLARPEHHGDILYFLFSLMSQEQRISFFRQAVETHKQTIHEPPFEDCIFACFLQWPYQDFLIPIITKLWGILPEDSYAQLLLMVAYRYVRYAESKQEKQDYAYGYLLVELLEHAPAQYKRYVFGTPIPDLGTIWGNKILLELSKKQPPYEFKDIKIFQRFLRQLTVEEKHSIMYSQFGREFCVLLIYLERFVILECILSECLTKDAMALFKKQFLLSHHGRDLYFCLLKEESESAANLFLNWGCFSEEEISAFKCELFFRNQDTFRFLLSHREINELDRLIWRCLPSQAARERHKEELIGKLGMDVCTEFILDSKWEQVTQFLSWCFSSEKARERFKQDLFAKSGIRIHSSFTLNQ